jgi:MFS family permease
VIVLLLHVFLMNGGTGTVNAFGNAYMDTDLNLSAAAIGFITGAGQFVAILAPIMMPVLAARRSNAWTLMMAALGTAVCIIPIAFVPAWYAVGIGRLGMIAIGAVWLPSLQAFQMNVVEKHWRSLAYGAVSTGMGFGFGIVSLVGGFIAATYGYSLLFSIGIIMCAAGGVVMWGIRKVPALQALTEPAGLPESANVISPVEHGPGRHRALKAIRVWKCVEFEFPRLGNSNRIHG